ncbi:hypothetical protein PIB30_032352 [Stylosanthes scabra]|uniref:Uncharacterized protein n=1 Tax=Stylosanthes scabra TaxID=79078 RepID=A0ABU6TE95_9FABA|nr:hypothetical protein [Stylosanthes scabra]
MDQYKSQGTNIASPITRPKDSSVEFKWSANLKADQIGWRVTESKENADPNWRGRSSAYSHVNKKPTPVSLIKSFANLSCRDDIMRRSTSEEDSISSTPILNAAQQVNPAPNPLFQIGSSGISSATKNKRQKLKHMARKGNSNVIIELVTGSKRTNEGNDIDTAEEEIQDNELWSAVRGEGANPIMAPNSQ